MKFNSLYLHLLITVSMTSTEPVPGMTCELFAESLTFTSQVYTPASDTPTDDETGNVAEVANDWPAFIHS